jgi:protein SCO1/2
MALSALPVMTSRGEREPNLWTSDPAARAWLVTFIYTRCLSVCQVLGSEFQQLQPEMSGAPGVRLASLSFDPARDGAAELEAYARRHHAQAAQWIVATPSGDAARERVLRETGVVVIPDGRGGYAHNAAIHVVVPPGKLVRIFGMDEHREALAFARALAP